MKILVFNTGSSSIKFQLFTMETETVLASGLVERIGEATGIFTYDRHGPSGDEKTVLEIASPDHALGMREIITILTDPRQGVIRETSEISAVGHRVVHGGEEFKSPALIDAKALEAIRKNCIFAPLHKPSNLIGSEVARALFPGVPHVAVFDTAFHQTIPPHAYHYALPQDLYRELGIRRYGFHGTSHQYVSKVAASMLGKPPEAVNLITLHLGNGASMTAVRKGQSVDTSMGMTPLEGLVMGTRSGDIDPALPAYLMERKKMTMREVDSLLNKQSGLKGICGRNDMRDILGQRDAGNSLAALAVEMYVYRIKKYIGAYWAALGKVDALVFTAGIGENSCEIRRLCCEGLEDLGIEIDPEANNKKTHNAREIQAPKSRVKVLVVPTNEELEIACQTRDLVRNVLLAP